MSPGEVVIGVPRSARSCAARSIYPWSAFALEDFCCSALEIYCEYSDGWRALEH
jgi:hypothetical protein